MGGMFALALEYKGFPPTKRAYNEVKKEVFLDVGRMWHERFRPLHFTEAGKARYGYFLRKGEGMVKGSKAYKRSYTGRKERLFGHTKPLVFSTEGERLSRLEDVRATSNMGKVILPRKFNFKHPKSRINMREELTRVTAGETRELIEFADLRLASRLRQLPPTTTSKKL